MSLSEGSSGEREGPALLPAAHRPLLLLLWLGGPLLWSWEGHGLLPALAGVGLALLSYFRARQGAIRQSIPPQGRGCDCLLEGEGRGGGEQPILVLGTALGCSISPRQGQGAALIAGGKELRRLRKDPQAAGLANHRCGHPSPFLCTLRVTQPWQSPPALSWGWFSAGLNPLGLCFLSGAVQPAQTPAGSGGTAAPHPGGGAGAPRWALTPLCVGAGGSAWPQPGTPSAFTAEMFFGRGMEPVRGGSRAVPQPRRMQQHPQHSKAA